MFRFACNGELGMETLMHHNGETGELICCAPAGEVVLKTVEMDIQKAHDIQSAIQDAYKKGWRLGRLNLQLNIERHMDSLNA